MKKAIFTIIILSSFLTGYSQNARKTKDGNFTAINRTTDSTSTGKTITTDQGVFPVYATPKGKLFYVKTTKTGKVYRSYLKIEGEN